MKMVKVKTTELVGIQLNWAVGLILNGGPPVNKSNDGIYWKFSGLENGWVILDGEEPLGLDVLNPCNDWDQGMTILDRYGINVRALRKEGHALDGTYCAMEACRLGTGTTPMWVEFSWPDAKNGVPLRVRWDGPTHLIAGLRCFVGVNLGEVVEVPEVKS